MFPTFPNVPKKAHWIISVEVKGKFRKRFSCRDEVEISVEELKEHVGRKKMGKHLKTIL